MSANASARAIVDTLKGSGPFTVFAPVDAAFGVTINDDEGRWACIALCKARGVRPAANRR